MSSIMDWFHNKPIQAFYILSFAISLILWLPRIVLGIGILEIILVVGLFGPALACIFVARATPARTQSARPRRSWLPFVVAWVASALILAANSRATTSETPIAVLIIFAALALVPAYIISSAFNGPSGVREVLSSLIHPSGWWGWYLLAILLPPATRLLSFELSKMMGWEILTRPTLPEDSLKLAEAVLITFLYTLLYAGGLNEEVGWTGFALPRLQARVSPLTATLVVWSFWILWHIPLHLAGFYNLSLNVVIGTFFARFVFTWLYIRSSGGMLTAILFHVSANTASQFIPVTNASLWMEAAIALVVVLGTRMWRKLPGESHAIQEGPALAS